MQGLIPTGDDFMDWDPEQIDTYIGWQRYNPVVKSNNSRINNSELANKNTRIKTKQMHKAEN